MHAEPSTRPIRAALQCDGVRVEYSGATVLDHVSIEVCQGEVVALLGPSGSGKSTLLQAVAGLVRTSRGEIRIGGRLVADGRISAPPDRRDVGMVFQNFALWPHICVLDSVAYPLRRAGQSRRAASENAAVLLNQLDIGDLAARRPAELSGGEQQRVGLARALARNACLYLLDEPTAHLDSHLRAAFQRSLLARQRERAAAIVYATHDAAEALSLATRVALIVDGRLIQTAPPAVVYDEPVDLRAAALTGAYSVLRARVAASSSHDMSIDFGGGPVRVAGGAQTPLRRGDRPRHGLLMIRPGWVRADGPFDAIVTSSAFRGGDTEYALDTVAGPLLMTLAGPPRHWSGDHISWGLSQAWLVDDAHNSDTDRASNAADRPGQPRAAIAAG